MPEKIKTRSTGQASILFRKANADDIPAMSAIRLAVVENALSDPTRITQQMYRDYLEASGRGWVAEQDGEMLGFCYAASGDASIWALFIAPAQEGRGIAKQLLALAVQWLFEQGHTRIQLSTAKDTRADRFYQAQGWTRLRVDEKDAYYVFQPEV